MKFGKLWQHFVEKRRLHLTVFDQERKRQTNKQTKNRKKNIFQLINFFLVEISPKSLPTLTGEMLTPKYLPLVIVS